MEVNQTKNYNDFLLKILENNKNIDENLYISHFKLNLYLTLLALNNNNYHESIYIKEYNIIDNFLRKVNNLKIKIQLKRKELEIEKLSKEIIEIYQTNLNLISKYNKENLNIIETINSKNAEKLTKLIDKLTKTKILKNDQKEENDQQRKIITENFFENKYYLTDDEIQIENNKTKETILIINLNDFFELFDYLINIDNYTQPFASVKSNREHTILIANLIKYTISNNIVQDMININKLIIPLTLTNMLLQEIENFEDIDTSHFNIENIKITELYSLGKNKQNQNNEKHAKINNIIIPNEYLYSKIYELIKNGMYYIQEDKFILENIENNTNSLKISINIDRMNEFLISNYKKIVHQQLKNKKRAK